MLILFLVLSIVDIIVIHKFQVNMTIMLEPILLLMKGTLSLIFKNCIKKMEKPKIPELIQSIRLQLEC